MEFHNQPGVLNSNKNMGTRHVLNMKTGCASQSIGAEKVKLATVLQLGKLYRVSPAMYQSSMGIPGSLNGAMVGPPKFVSWNGQWAKVT